MKRNLRPVIASAATLAITGGALAATIGTAAASYPGSPWQPASASPSAGQANSANEIGTLAFFNASGTQVTSGTNINHLFDYALASTSDPANASLANLEFAGPQPAVDPGNWATASDEASTTPNTAAGTPANLRNTTTPLVTLDSAGANLNAGRGTFTSQTATGYANVYEVRVFTSDASTYWAADVQINGTGPSATWTEVYGSPVTSVTQVVASPNPQGQGGAVTLTATVDPADATNPVGTVAFTSGATNLGSTSTFTGHNASVTTSSLPQGSNPITATFTPSNAGAVTYSGSNGSTSETINPPAGNTSTTLAISGNTTTGTDSILSGTVSPSSAAGTVSFFDNSSGTPVNGSSVTVSGGGYTYTLTGGFAAGSHSVVAKFTPSSPASFNPSQSSAVPFFTSAPVRGACAQTGSQCSDTQVIQTSVPVGTLVISTPYTAQSPLVVPQLALNNNGTYWTGHATFQCITVTDATSGGTPFVASALAQDLNLQSTPPSPPHGFTSISAQNVGLTNFAESAATCPDGTTPVNSYTAAVTPTDNSAASGVNPGAAGSAGLGGTQPHVVLTGTGGGEGTATYDGTLTINAPTSTDAGTYQGNVIFTVTD